MAARRDFRPWSISGLRFRLGFPELLVCALTFSVSTAAAFAVSSAYGEVAAALIFVLGITVAGALSGLASALIMALGAFLIYNFYMVEPVLTLRLATGQDRAPLIVFNLCAVVAGVLAGQLKDHAEANRRSNLQLVTLLDLSQALQSAERLQDVVTTITNETFILVGAEIILLRVVGSDLVPMGAAPGFEFRGVAEAALMSDDALTRSGALTARRLDGSSATFGVMVMRELRPVRLESSFLIAFGNLIALALERGTLFEEIAERRALARIEELKSALLSSVSHDFRTPLTAISASASSLIDYHDQLDETTTQRLLRSIVDECGRLNRYTANLLEMSRLEAGGPPPRLQILSVTEMLGAAIQRIQARRIGRMFTRRDHSSELLVSADPALFELVLVNVLDNAILYSDDGTRIIVESDRIGDLCRIVIADEGQGIPDEDLHRVFERFVRVNRSEASPRGSGLGLAIAQGFVRALGGSIEALTPGIGDVGTKIIIHLPLAATTAAS